MLTTMRIVVALTLLLALGACSGKVERPGGIQQPAGEINSPLADALPALAELDGTPGQTLNRAASGLLGETRLGTETFLTGGPQLTDPLGLRLQPSAKGLSWAIYQAEATESLLQSIVVLGDPLDLGDFYVAIADYSLERWVFYQAEETSSSFGLGALDLAGDRFRSPEGHFYIAVAAWDADNFLVKEVSFHWNGNPAVPLNLTASSLEHLDRIVLDWDFLGEADFFVIERGPAEGGPFETVTEVPATTRTYDDIFDDLTNDYPALELVWYRIAAKLQQEEGDFTPAVAGERNFYPIEGFDSPCVLSETGATIIWESQFAYDKVQVFRDSTENLIHEMTFFEIVSGSYTDMSASTENSHQYWVRPFFGTAGGPLEGPVVAARCSWDGPAFENPESFSNWGGGPALTHFNGKPSGCYRAQSGQGPEAEHVIEYFRADSVFPQGAAEIQSSRALEVPVGELGDILEITEFEGLPVIFYTQANSSLRYLYAKNSNPAGPLDWQEGPAGTSQITGGQIDILLFNGKPVVAHWDAISASVKVTFVMPGLVGSLLFGESEIEISALSHPQISEIEGRIAVAYGHGAGNDLVMAIAESSTLAPNMTWDIQAVSEQPAGLSDMDFSVVRGLPVLFYIDETSPGSLFRFSGKTPLPDSADGWSFTGHDLRLVGFESIELFTNCHGNPLIFFNDTNGKFGYVNSEKGVIEPDGQLLLFLKEYSIDENIVNVDSISVSTDVGYSAVLLNRTEQPSPLSLLKVQEMPMLP